MSEMARLDPFSAKSIAVDSPMPDPAPVIRETLFFNLMFLVDAKIYVNSGSLIIIHELSILISSTNSDVAGIRSSDFLLSLTT